MANPADASALSERARRVLEFEREWWGHSAAKERRIRAEFGWSPARYYQVLNTVIDDAASHAYDPILVSRLHEVRDARATRRRTRRDTVAS
ncbi:DUF3263 domain-containing protein [Microcella sp.]|uniref:DUF3263 domain-containing protein n=1 Tax=Microcella sp. TaxID=1913979 RepID=UPI00391DFA88